MILRIQDNSFPRNPTWWRRRTQLERVLIVLITTISALCVVLVVALALTSYKQAETLPTMSALDAEKTNESESFSLQQLGKTAEENICFSEECVHTASYLLDAMDLKAEPCDDFYQFACGQFREQTIPDDKESLSVFTSVDELVKKQLRKIVSEPIKPDEPRHLVNPKNLYKICMDKETIEERGLQDAQEIIDYFGGWPVVEGDKWDMGSFDWKEITYKFRSRGFSVDYLLDFSVTVDSKNSTTRIIELDAGALALSRKYLMRGLEDRIVAAYYSYMVDLAVLLGAEKEKAEAELKETLDFEIQLANVSLPSEERRDYEKLYNKMTLTELQQKFPTIPWMEYFSRLLGPYILIDEDEPVIVIEPQYISALEQILQHTPKRIQANYLMWRVVSAVANYMPERFRQRTLKFHTAITGSTEEQPRWKQCVGIASGSVTYAVGSLYIKKFFKHESKKNALELVDRIRREMVKTLQKVDWMDEDTRKNALEKAKSIKEFIAYPDELLDDNKLAEFYQNYDVSNVTSFLEAILRTAEFATNFMMSRLRQPVNKTEWLIHASPAVVVNALYNDDENFDFYWGAIGQLSSKNRRLAGIDPLWAVPRKYDVTNVTSYLDAVLRTTKFATNYTLSRLRQPVNKTEWLRHASPAVVNAFYNGLENSIDFPAGILQGIFFNSDRPSYMNYGGIGFVIGHEITHGFDDQGRQFDKDGNLKEWWAAETKAKYLQKAQCIIYQYGNYTDKQVDMNLNGINTQGENIADNGGLKQAYRAYLNWIKDNEEEKRLPGLQKYSPRQMFWIAAASTWCTVYRNESLSNRITTGLHSPGEFRVKGPFSNSEDFARDFDCPRGSVMNPIHKCAVW
ncbi:M13 family metallopeptidase neprilysin 2 isoform X3 [Rhodnius prolixus]|uniref:M13 family metallopeptidase neprilysin 2 isoform X3 n=1 Tax=Rhodnius prolixus TaxID=13249 RepID=UPI003D18819E